MREGYPRRDRGRADEPRPPLTMPISEKEISILIPTYRYRDKVGRAVESAIASGAGEIVVTDDHSCDGTMELLAGYKDPRLRVYENPINLGLWENHLAALRHATLPWIKFIQADDYLLPGGLAAYAAAADFGIAVVWGCPIVTDDDTGETRQYHTFNQARRLSGPETLELCLQVGWLLGSPSHMMLRADAITRDTNAWMTEISADLVIGSIATTFGDVALLPPGAIGQGAHARQDAMTQGKRRGLHRMVASTAYLRASQNPELQRFATLWAALNRKMALRIAMSGALSRQIPPGEALRLVLRNFALSIGVKSGWRAQLRIARMVRHHSREPHDLDRLISEMIA